MIIKSGAFYLDYIIEDPLAGASTPISINEFPFDGQEDVPASDAKGSSELHLTVVDIGSDGLSSGNTRVFVTTSDGGLVEVFDGTSFHADWSESSYVEATSAGSGVVDEHRFILVRDTAFISESTVTVRILAETTALSLLDKTYSFTVEDLTKPEVLSVETRGLRTLLVKFNETMRVEGDGALGDALRIRNISGGVEVVESNGINPAKIRMSRDTFTEDDVGMYIGIANAQNALNNDIFTISGFISAREVEIDNNDVEGEELPRDAIVTVSPYKVNGVPDDTLVRPFFNPIVTSAAAVTSDEISLVLHAEITQQREYTFFSKLVADAANNIIDPSETEFTTEPCGAPSDREFSIEAMVPSANLEQDTSKDLIRLLRVYDEIYQLIICDIDNFTNIMDIDLVDSRNLDALLLHLGVPFSFAGSLSITDKRRLASIAVEMYKRKGGRVAIEAVVSFILGIDIDIQHFLDEDNTWILGENQLGVDAILGPGASFLRFSFQVEVFQDLTELQTRRLIEIVEYMKPAHTHFIRIIEPDTVPTTVFTPWSLGEDLLGESTLLG